MGTRRLSRLLLASARRVAPGGESGLGRWSVPALALLLVVYVALSALSANGRASDAATAASRARDVESSAAQASIAPGPASKAALRRSYSDLAAAAGDDPGVGALGRAVDAASGRGAYARATAMATATANRLSQASDSATARAQRAQWLTLIAGGVLALLLLWSFWAKRARSALERSEQRYRSLIERSSELVFIVDESGRVRFVTPVVEKRLGYEPPALLDTALVDIVEGDTVDLTRPCDGAAPWRLRHSDGSWVGGEAEWVDLREDLSVRGFVITVRDVAERLALEEQIRHQAFHDSLTGLANRALFEDRVTHALERFRRDSERSVAVLFIDLDDFKTVNDSLGHAAGDELLRQVAFRLCDCTRRADTVARLGGDEFAVLVEGAYAAGTASVLGDRIQAALERPVMVGHEELFVHASIGIAAGELASTAADLLRNADIAMYSAKAGGKSRSVLFEPKMGMSARKRQQLSGDLRRAVRDGELVVKYQPLIRLADKRLLGVEALLRWAHPTLGELPPSEFIPLAEETGLIVAIGGFVLDEACRQLNEWQSDHPNGHPDYVSVNVSARQFQREGQVLEQVRTATEASALDPAKLMLELTETVLMQDHEAIVRELAALRELGVRIAIDDFGTGYSALSYLKRFPIDTVKMDRSFVQNLGVGKADSALIRSVVELGEALNMQIVAEGIEGQHQLDSVTGVRCDVGQGYFFSPPLAPGGIEALLREAADRGAAPA